MAAATGPKRTRQTYTRYQTLELEKVRKNIVKVVDILVAFVCHKEKKTIFS